MKKSTNVSRTIKQARLLRCMTATELAKKIDVTKQAVSQYENGKIIPMPNILDRIAEVLNFPISFFYRHIDEAYNDTNSGLILFRSNKTTPKKERDRAEEYSKIFIEYNNILQNYVSYPKLNIPKNFKNIDSNNLDKEDIEKMSNDLRTHWGLSQSPIQNITRVFEENGIIVSNKSFENTNIKAFAKVHRGIPYIFLATNKTSNFRIRFSASHEMGHILFHQQYTNKIIKDGELSDILESQANYFAGAFLLPRDAFSNDVRGSSLDHMIQLKLKWKVSIGAIINRCDILGLLTENQISYIKSQMAKRGYWHSEPYDKEFDLEKPVLGNQAMKLLLENNILNIDNIEDEFKTFKKELEDNLSLEDKLLIKKNINIIKFKK
jgi:Zn-dependent peptidase ImmA (M78 family)/DNA-binding XRE family transcriptional regulator